MTHNGWMNSVRVRTMNPWTPTWVVWSALPRLPHISLRSSAPPAQTPCGLLSECTRFWPLRRKPQVHSSEVLKECQRWSLGVVWPLIFFLGRTHPHSCTQWWFWWEAERLACLGGAAWWFWAKGWDQHHWGVWNQSGELARPPVIGPSALHETTWFIWEGSFVKMNSFPQVLSSWTDLWIWNSVLFPCFQGNQDQRFFDLCI